MRPVPLVVGLLLGGFLVPALLPAPATAGTCPDLENGVVDRASYRLGEVIDFYGNYHDFADPGTVSIAFERESDGSTRQFTAYISPDGSWYLMLVFRDEADVGRWIVTVVVDQTSGRDTCTDRVTIVARATLPDTATVTRRSAPGGQLPAPWLVAALGILLATTWVDRARPRRR